MAAPQIIVVGSDGTAYPNNQPRRTRRRRNRDKKKDEAKKKKEAGKLKVPQGTLLLGFVLFWLSPFLGTVTNSLHMWMFTKSIEMQMHNLELLKGTLKAFP